MIAYKYCVKDGNGYEPLVKYVPKSIAISLCYPKEMPYYKQNVIYRYDNKLKRQQHLRIGGYWLFKEPVGRSTISGIISRDIPLKRTICLLKCSVNKSYIKDHKILGGNYKNSIWTRQFKILEEIPLNKEFIESHPDFFKNNPYTIRNVEL